MKSYRKELWFRVPSRRGLVNITGEVEKALEESGVQEGLVLVNAMNITASVFINDDEPGLHRDLEAWLEKLAPEFPIVSEILEYRGLAKLKSTSEAVGDGKGSRGGRNRRAPGFWHLGADFLL